MSAAESAPRRHVRLFFALAVASLLGTFAVYSAFAGDSTPLIDVAQAAEGHHQGQDVRLRGMVAAYSGDATDPSGLRIVLHPENGPGTETVVVRYRGSVPDAFRVGRQIVVDGRLEGRTFAARTDSLVTKCPSKYNDRPADGATGQAA